MLWKKKIDNNINKNNKPIDLQNEIKKRKVCRTDCDIRFIREYNFNKENTSIPYIDPQINVGALNNFNFKNNLVVEINHDINTNLRKESFFENTVVPKDTVKATEPFNDNCVSSIRQTFVSTNSVIIPTSNDEYDLKDTNPPINVSDTVLFNENIEEENLATSIVCRTHV